MLFDANRTSSSECVLNKVKCFPIFYPAVTLHFSAVVASSRAASCLFSHVVKLLVTRLFPIERIGPLLHPCDVEALIHVTSELPLAKRTSWLHSLNWHLASYGSLLFTVFIKMKFGVKIYRIKCQA